MFEVKDPESTYPVPEKKKNLGIVLADKYPLACTFFLAEFHIDKNLIESHWTKVLKVKLLLIVFVSKS